MTQDEIIRMAREAGLWPGVTDVFPKELERFAALVAAHEREACAKVCESFKYKMDAGVDNIVVAIRARSNQ